MGTAPIELFSHQITMLRARLPTLGRSVLARRSFAFTPKVMAEGDTGAIRAGGAAASDAFSKREKASEDKRAKLKALREKIKNAQAHMKELESYIDETMR